MTEKASLSPASVVRWKSALGYTYDGTVVRGNDTDGYDLITADGATGTGISLDKIMVRLEDAPVDDGLTPEQRAAVLDDRCTRAAEARVTDTIMALGEILRADAGPDLDQTAGDDLRLLAADYVAAAGERMREVLRRQVADKRARLAKAAEVTEPAVVVEPLPTAAVHSVDEA